MRPFEYLSPNSRIQALSLLGSAWGRSEILAGGTDLLALMKDDILAPKPAGCSTGQSCLSTRWIYNPGDQHPRYLSFNTPVGSLASSQCGRAVYSDVHLSGVSSDAQRWKKVSK